MAVVLQLQWQCLGDVADEDSDVGVSNTAGVVASGDSNWMLLLIWHGFCGTTHSFLPSPVCDCQR